MSIADHHRSHSNGKNRRLFPFWQSGTTTSSSKQNHQLQFHHHHNNNNSSNENGVVSTARSSNKLSSVAKSLMPARRRLRLDPGNNLYFPYEPGKQVRSAVRIKNHSSSHVAFKFQTTAPKSCYMRPPGGVLAPGESLIATVFKFVEQPDKNEKQLDQRSKDCKVKFKIMSLKVKEGTDFVPELFDEQKDEVVVERILRVIFLDADRPTPALEKLKHQLAEAEAQLELRRKPQVETGPKVVGQGLVIDEWKERREKYLARQQEVEAVDLM
ncbi:hypothetical protein M8C21_007564 [Ambrosia artemisiifolia]|uniref:MSP domain-containing protein n=1 Tax=Ambrosia artemisiifolia TaxID=4212 RepID=A0AAD5GMF5_AMBAR|nr:hypothetical protein M8C21_007564 [Ambrosia artemisiifolia]